MLDSSSSGTQLILDGPPQATPLQKLRRTKILMMVAAGLLTVVVLSVVFGLAFGQRKEDVPHFGFHHAVLARLAMANFSFDSSNQSVAVVEVDPGQPSSGMELVSLSVLTKIVLERGPNETNARHRDNNGEMDKVVDDITRFQR